MTVTARLSTDRDLFEPVPSARSLSVAMANRAWPGVGLGCVEPSRKGRDDESSSVIRVSLDRAGTFTPVAPWRARACDCRRHGRHAGRDRVGRQSGHGHPVQRRTAHGLDRLAGHGDGVRRQLGRRSRRGEGQHRGRRTGRDDRLRDGLLRQHRNHALGEHLRHDPRLREGVLRPRSGSPIRRARRSTLRSRAAVPEAGRTALRA
jgi:hypothetical protein